MVSIRVIAMALALVACGSPTPTQTATPTPTPTPATPKPPTPPAATAPTSNVFIYVVVETYFAERFATPTIAEAKEWAKVNAVAPTCRVIMIKQSSPSDKVQAAAKALAALERVKRGEDFAKVAKEVSDDKADDGAGGWPGDHVPKLIPPLREAYAALAPGEVSKTVITSPYGYHVVKKEKLTDEVIVAAYKKANSDALAKRIGDDVATRVKSQPTTSPITELTFDRAVSFVMRSRFGEPARIAIVNSEWPIFAGRTIGDAVTPSTRSKNATCAEVLRSPLGGVRTIAAPDHQGYLVVASRPETQEEANVRTKSTAPDARAVEPKDVDEDPVYDLSQICFGGSTFAAREKRLAARRVDVLLEEQVAPERELKK